MEVIRHSHNTVYAALKGDGGVFDSWGADQSRRRFLNAEFLEFVIPGLLSCVVDCLTKLVSANIGQQEIRPKRRVSIAYVAMFHTNSLVSMQFMTVSLERFL